MANTIGTSRASQPTTHHYSSDETSSHIGVDSQTPPSEAARVRCAPLLVDRFVDGMPVTSAGAQSRYRQCIRDVNGNQPTNPTPQAEAEQDIKTD